MPNEKMIELDEESPVEIEISTDSPENEEVSAEKPVENLDSDIGSDDLPW